MTPLDIIAVVAGSISLLYLGYGLASSRSDETYPMGVVTLYQCSVCRVTILRLEPDGTVPTHGSGAGVTRGVPQCPGSRRPHRQAETTGGDW